jgi:arylsulfatase A-like enzyme
MVSCKFTQVSKKNIIFVLVDALRQDHLGVYGYERNTSPNIDAFANDALVFQNAISQSGWTTPSIVALFTSKYPKGPIFENRTLTQWLHKYGYQTIAFVANPLLLPQKGYANGFESYNLHEWEDDSKLVDLSLDWIRSRDASRPFFLFLHFMGSHAPYRPNPPYDRRFGDPYTGQVDESLISYKKLMAENKPVELSEQDLNRLIDLYDGEIACIDDLFEKLNSGLKDAELYEDSIIIFVADHGEEFMDHGGVGHGHTVFDELIRVPLIIRGLGDLNGMNYSGLFEFIDLGPTLVSYLGFPFNYEVDGEDFLEHLKKNEPLKKVAFSEVHRTFGMRAGNWFISARTENEKVIYNPHEKKYIFYDLKNDKAERYPIEEEQAQSMEFLKASIEYWRKTYGKKGYQMKVDPETLKALRSLGYIR